MRIEDVYNYVVVYSWCVFYMGDGSGGVGWGGGGGGWGGVGGGGSCMSCHL